MDEIEEITNDLSPDDSVRISLSEKEIAVLQKEFNTDHEWVKILGDDPTIYRSQNAHEILNKIIEVNWWLLKIIVTEWIKSKMKDDEES